eukprot:CAMPEP_0177597650 /NCGR_PEP_ID=MMETSP0419_2-20121207/11838_1 /TAXON_ID=582737 /ORGANISM="Tetraselmis sp., Strain GSL018" /LENGTH=70 /DNA_ID=CAMNT_0019089861 /DNA_START=358 /DNA_END=567 /DNA_ORIENTATION=-
MLLGNGGASASQGTAKGGGGAFQHSDPGGALRRAVRAAHWPAEKRGNRGKAGGAGKGAHLAHPPRAARSA